MALPLLQLADLRIQREETSLLAGVDWKVQPGEHWVILGPNGAGKTSLLRALTGYLPPTSGNIQVLGHTYGEHDWRELRLVIGWVSHSLQSSIPGEESALDTVISGKFAQLDLWARVTRADRAAARRCLASVGGLALAKRLWRMLSQGERQRVLIARALMARPRLLILDEPCAGMDPVSRQDFLHHLQALARRRRGPALLLVTHHVEEITPAFTHALLLRQGRAVAAGPLASTLSSASLSQAFDRPVTLVQEATGYRLVLPAATRAR